MVMFAATVRSSPLCKVVYFPGGAMVLVFCLKGQRRKLKPKIGGAQSANQTNSTYVQMSS